MEHPMLTLIKTRRSIRRYKADQVPEAALRQILEAGSYAPSAGGDQPWYLAAVQSPSLLQALNTAAKEAAVGMGGHLAGLGADPQFHCLYGAPTAVLVFGSESSPAPETDCAAAVQNMLLAAQALGLGSCWVYFTVLAFYGPQADQLRARLQVPEGYRPVASIALGFGDETPDPPPRRDHNIILLK